MKLRFTRAGTLRSPARKLILAGLIAGVAAAGVATATIAGASTHRDSKRTHTTASTWQATWKFSAATSSNDPSFTQLLGVNDHNQMTGYYGSGEDAKHPNKGFLVDGSWYHHSNWRGENYPGSAQTQVVGISNTGVIVGFFVTRTGANYGFAKWNGHWIPVAYPGSTRSGHPFNQLLGVNDKGIAAGFYNDSAGNSHGYLYNIKTRQFFLLRVPVTATSVVITGVNNNNVIVGFITVGKATVAFVIKNGVFHQLSLGAKTNTQALGVNASGAVVGSFLDAAGVMHGFLWTSTGMHQIDSPWAGKGGTLLNGINNNGVVVGFFVNTKNVTVGLIVVASTTKATNYNWNGRISGTITPIPSNGGLSTMWPTNGSSVKPNAVINGGNLANGGTTTAQSGHHW